MTLADRTVTVLIGRIHWDAAGRPANRGGFMLIFITQGTASNRADRLGTHRELGVVGPRSEAQETAGKFAAAPNETEKKAISKRLAASARWCPFDEAKS